MKNRLYLAAALCGLLAAASCTKDNGVGIMTKEDYEGAVENGIPTYADDYSPIANWDFHPNWNLANVHDPSVAYYDGYYYMFGTSASYGNEHDKATIGRQYQGKRSKDLVNWTHVYGPMSTAPAWVKDSLNNIRGRMDLPAIENPVYGYWAPVIRVVDGKLRMYYSIVVDNCIKTGGTGFDGSWTERAFIGMCETTDPSNPDAWEDKGFVVCSSTAKAAGDWGRASAGGDYGNAYFYYNAIDPTYIVAPDGKHWLIYGSWHSGFALLEINPATGKPVKTLGNPWANGDVADLQSRYGVRIATRVPTGTWSHWQGSEAPEIIYNNGYYYLFMAYDGLDIPYNTRVARSSKIEGPYVDIKGTDITAGGVAYPIVTHPYKFSQGDGWVGISHCGVFQQDGTGDWFYASQGRLPAGVNGNESSNALMMGHIRRIVWCPSSADSLNDLWPIALPERYAGVEGGKVTSAEIAGTWEHINLTYQQGVMDTAQTLTLAAGGQMSGALTGTWTFDESSQYLTLAPASGPKVVVVVAREADWEASPRQATIVYAGTEKTLDATWWGKKVK